MINQQDNEGAYRYSVKRPINVGNRQVMGGFVNRSLDEAMDIKEIWEKEGKGPVIIKMVETDKVVK